MEQSVSLGSLLYVTAVAPYTPRPGESEPRTAGTHQALGSSVPALREMADRAGLSFSHFDNVWQIPLSEIEHARVLALYTIGDTPWSEEQKALILQKVRAGELGVVGLHSATDSAQSWGEFERLVGAHSGRSVMSCTSLRDCGPTRISCCKSMVVWSRISTSKSVVPFFPCPGVSKKEKDAVFIHHSATLSTHSKTLATLDTSTAALPGSSANDSRTREQRTRSHRAHYVR
jgi:hypothetical protein